MLMLSPPLDMSPRWFSGHTAYSMAKFGMSMCVLGMSAEFKEDGIAFNALWPRTGIATASASDMHSGRIRGERIDDRLPCVGMRPTLARQRDERRTRTPPPSNTTSNR